jgi:2-isopropylmalate synthase
MHPQVGKRIYDLADKLGRELTPEEIRDAFHKYFANLTDPLSLSDYDLDHHAGKRGEVLCTARVVLGGDPRTIEGTGNGPINAFVHALAQAGLKDFALTDYRSHAVRQGSDSSAAAYVQLRHEDDRIAWGAGLDPSIEMAGLKALVSAWNLLR